MTMFNEHTALLVIDMQKAFIEKKSPLCIMGAKDTVPACASVVAQARENNSPVIWVRRIYREDGSDVEFTRAKVWEEGGKPLTKSAKGPLSASFPPELVPLEGETIITKPRWSAFFQTELDMILRRKHIDTVILTGTTTPNCIRTTCYDAIALDYKTVIIEEACSSDSEEIQKANMEDMARIGAVIL